MYPWNFQPSNGFSSCKNECSFPSLESRQGCKPFLFCHASILVNDADSMYDTIAIICAYPWVMINMMMRISGKFWKQKHDVTFLVFLKNENVMLHRTVQSTIIINNALRILQYIDLLSLAFTVTDSLRHTLCIFLHVTVRITEKRKFIYHRCVLNAHPQREVPQSVRCRFSFIDVC